MHYGVCNTEYFGRFVPKILFRFTQHQNTFDSLTYTIII